MWVVPSLSGQATESDIVGAAPLEVVEVDGNGVVETGIGLKVGAPDEAIADWDTIVFGELASSVIESIDEAGRPVSSAGCVASLEAVLLSATSVIEATVVDI